jgi:hypothetical protein
LGNVLGFSEERWTEVLDAAARLTAPDGLLLIEGVAGPGEHSRYLQRLPRGAAARALRTPERWIDRRVDAEGFQPMDPRKPEAEASFRRITPEILTNRLGTLGLRTVEVAAVASVMGTDPERLDVVRQDEKAWDGLLRLEERWGAQPARWERAAAFLLAAERRPPNAPPRPGAPVLPIPPSFGGHRPPKAPPRSRSPGVPAGRRRGPLAARRIK